MNSVTNDVIQLISVFSIEGYGLFHNLNEIVTLIATLNVVKSSNHSSKPNKINNFSENHISPVNLSKIRTRPFQNNNTSWQEKFPRIF